MEMTTAQALVMVGVMALLTVCTRALPFALFPADKQTPPYVLYLGRALPFAIMGMLVVYCLRGVQLTAFPYGLPEGIGVLAVAALYLWRRNTLLAIGVGTVLYMLLVQNVFA